MLKIHIPNILFSVKVPFIESFDWTSFLSSILFVIILLILSALISGSEAAFFSLSPSEKESLKDDESKKGQLVTKLLKTPKQLLATILIANNFINVEVISN